MKDHHRSPLESAASSANAALQAGSLSRIENMAIGGKAGLRLRGTSRSRTHTPLSQSGGATALSTDTFALSTDASSVESVDGRRGSPPRFQLQAPSTPLAMDAPARPEAKTKRSKDIKKADSKPLHERKRLSSEYLLFFDDTGVANSSSQATVALERIAMKRLGTGHESVQKQHGADSQEEWKVEVAKDSPAKNHIEQTLGFCAEESADLDEEEEQRYLELLQRKKDAKQRQEEQKASRKDKNSCIQKARVCEQSSIRNDKSEPRDRYDWEKENKMPTDAPHKIVSPAPIADSGALSQPEQDTQAHVMRKFRVLPSVPTSSASQIVAIEPRILEVKVVQNSQSKSPATSVLNESGGPKSLQDKSLSPFSAFYRETAGSLKSSGVFPQDSDLEASGHGSLFYAGTSHISAIGDKSVHFAPTPCNASLDPVSSFTATDTTQICSARGESPAPTKIGGYKNTITDVAGSDLQAEDVSSSTAADAKVSNNKISFPGHDLNHLESSLLARTLNTSARADSWSSLGIKLEPIASSLFCPPDTGLVGGLKVVNLEVGGPAEMAGITVGDVIVFLSNGVLAKGTSAMEATSLLREQPGLCHVLVSRRRTLWGQEWKRQQEKSKHQSRMMIALPLQINQRKGEAFGTDISCGFTLRDGKKSAEEWECLPIVSDLIDGSSAHKNGMRIGDVLVGIGTLQVGRLPPRVAMSLLQGEHGSQVLLGIQSTHTKTKSRSPSVPLVEGLPHESVQWMLLERRSGFHVSVQTSSSVVNSCKVQTNQHNPITQDGMGSDLDTELFSNDGFTRKHLPISLSPVGSDASVETYFAYRNSTDNSMPDSPESFAKDQDLPLDESLIELRNFCAQMRERRNTSAESDTGKATVAKAEKHVMDVCVCIKSTGGVDQSLEDLRKRSRAREKRQAFLASLGHAHQEHEGTHSEFTAARACSRIPEDVFEEQDGDAPPVIHTGLRTTKAVSSASLSSGAVSQGKALALGALPTGCSDRRFAMMRVLMSNTALDDSFLDFLHSESELHKPSLCTLQSLGDLPARQSADQVHELRRTRSIPDKVSGPLGDQQNHNRHEGKDKAVAWDGDTMGRRKHQKLAFAMLKTPPKPVTPNVKTMSKYDLEQAAWQYVNQHQQRSELLAERGRKADADALCVAKATGLSLSLSHQVSRLYKVPHILGNEKMLRRSQEKARHSLHGDHTSLKEKMALKKAGNDVVEAILLVRSSKS